MLTARPVRPVRVQVVRGWHVHPEKAVHKRCGCNVRGFYHGTSWLKRYVRAICAACQRDGISCLWILPPFIFDWVPLFNSTLAQTFLFTGASARRRLVNGLVNKIQTIHMPYVLTKSCTEEKTQPTLVFFSLNSLSMVKSFQLPAATTHLQRPRL